ncbi:MAG: Gfo/Idh/MocA family oxidoreductase [Planctomycetota bacterium]|nr:Gfo/Idh/MocA family oxidoreductase [Planctomycetota bacterium]MDA1179011.1 Gfo/Idh/MocA family oxidoreductase [Planctomycetota bacterium]
MKLRVGVIGIGEDWEKRYRPALRALGDRFEVRAVYDEVSQRARQAAQEFNAIPLDGYWSLCRRDDVDAVLLLENQWYGALPLVAACEVGKAVYCASTFDLQFEEAQSMNRRVDEAGIAFMAEFRRRLYPATLRLKELIATKLGSPRLLFCHQRGVLASFSSRAAVTSGTNLSHRAMIELVDWCGYVVGSAPRAVFGVEHRDKAGDVDYQMMSLDFSDWTQPGTGPLAQISFGQYLSPHWPESITFRPPSGLQVCCEKGVAFVDLPANLVWFDEAGRHVESLDTERPVGEQLLSLFYRSVTSLVRKSSDLHDAYRALFVSQMAQESFRTGQRVRLP